MGAAPRHMNSSSRYRRSGRSINHISTCSVRRYHGHRQPSHPSSRLEQLKRRCRRRAIGTDAGPQQGRVAPSSRNQGFSTDTRAVARQNSVTNRGKAASAERPAGRQPGGDRRWSGYRCPRPWHAPALRTPLHRQLTIFRLVLARSGASPPMLRARKGVRPVRWTPDLSREQGLKSRGFSRTLYR